jgi:hypothetical protein
VTRIIEAREPCLFSPWLAYAVIAFLMLAYTAGYAFSTPHTDTADELMRAYEIRRGLAYPLEGPFLGNAVHLGPVWFYLVALPLWISPQWLAAALFIGFVCSFKFPLAYHCGRQLVDGDFGMLWAVCMFVPGWTSFEPLLFLNPTAIAATSLLVLAIALRAIDRAAGPWIWLALGVALALAVHVHPTSMPIAVLVIPAWIAARRRGEPLARALVAMAAGFALPFLPYVVSQFQNGFADFGSASSYMTGQVSLPNIVNAPAVVLDAIGTGPRVVAQYLLGWSERAAALLGVAALVIGALSLAALGARDARRGHAIFLGALALFAAWIACMRPTTPFQFTWMLGPPLAAVMAMGLWTLSRRPRWRWTAGAALVVLVSLNTYAIARTARTVNEGQGVLPSRVLDIKGRIPAIEFHDVWFPAIGHARLGHLLCDTQPLSLHGHLAYIVDKDLALDTLFACNDRSKLSLAGSAGRHALGMTRHFWGALGVEASCWIGSLGITSKVTPLVQRDAIAIADGSRYLPRVAHRAAPTPVTFSVAAPANAAVLVTNVLGEYERFAMIDARVDGRPASSVATNDVSALYVVPGARDPRPVLWTFTVATTDIGAVDVVAVDPSADRGSGCDARAAPPSRSD